MGNKSKQVREEGAKASPSTQPETVKPPTPPSDGKPTSSGGGGNSSQEPLRAWPVYVLVLILLFGVGAAVYMTWHHEEVIYGHSDVAIVGCEESQAVNCDVVNTSDWSEFFGIPVALFAIPTYLLLGYLALTGLLRREKRLIGYALGISLLTVLHAGFLFYISKTQLHFVCLWCIRMYAVNTGTLVLLALTVKGSPISVLLESGGDLIRWPAPMRKAAVIFASILLLCVGLQKAYRHSLTGGVEIPTTDAEPKQSDGKDPTGTLVQKTFAVVTEDKKQATLTLMPDDIYKGNPNASIVLVEYADFECGYCKRFSAELKRVYEAYSDRVLFVFRHFPMDPACNPGVTNRRHGSACLAAMASECAKAQGKFWAFHDLAFKNQHKLDREALEAYAAAGGVDVSSYKSCMSDPTTKQAVLSDAQSGAALDIHGTPRLYINGERYVGSRTAEGVAKIIEGLLGSDATSASQAASKLRNVATTQAVIPADVPEMRQVNYGDLKFEIDTFEASLENGKAVSGLQKVPAYRMTWFDAKAACEAAGKRLCTEREWLAACQGALPIDDDNDGQYSDDMIEGQAYPYSDYHQEGTCWDGHERDETIRPVYTGSFPGCVSKDGVYDLTGNMEEWVGETEDKALLLGGAYDTKEDKARCYRANDTFGPGMAHTRNGFRCCRTLP